MSLTLTLCIVVRTCRHCH